MVKNNESMELTVGNMVPDFELPDINMKFHKLSDYNNRRIILAFFPAAESPVCTTEMCTFRDSLNQFTNSNTQIIGISIDGPFANKFFSENRHLNFPVLSDYNREVIRKYGIVMKDLGNLKDYNAAKRSIFILNDNKELIYKWVSDNPLIEPDYNEINKNLN